MTRKAKAARLWYQESKPAELKLKAVGTLQDRSELSDEMADLCENLPIYVVVEGEPEVDSTTAIQPTKTVPAKRK